MNKKELLKIRNQIIDDLFDKGFSKVEIVTILGCNASYVANHTPPVYRNYVYSLREQRHFWKQYAEICKLAKTPIKLCENK